MRDIIPTIFRTTFLLTLWFGGLSSAIADTKRQTLSLPEINQILSTNIGMTVTDHSQAKGYKATTAQEEYFQIKYHTQPYQAENDLCRREYYLLRVDIVDNKKSAFHFLESYAYQVGGCHSNRQWIFGDANYISNGAFLELHDAIQSWFYELKSSSSVTNPILRDLISNWSLEHFKAIRFKADDKTKIKVFFQKPSENDPTYQSLVEVLFKIDDDLSISPISYHKEDVHFRTLK